MREVSGTIGRGIKRILTGIMASGMSKSARRCDDDLDIMIETERL
jgi:hypothetical protein